jgi:hypothetical protein
LIVYEENTMINQNLMIWFASLALSFTLASGLALAKSATTIDQKGKCQEEKPQARSKTHQSPLACDRLALDPVARKRHFDELGPALRYMRKAVRELPDGYEFQFPADPKTIAMVAEWAAGERLCCPFFNIQLRMEAEGGPFWLRVTGRKGTKEFLRVDGASWVQP